MDTTRVVDNIRLYEGIVVEVLRHRPEGGWHAPQPVPITDLITTAGRNFLAARIGANVGSPMAHMAVGSGSTAPALGDTALLAEISRKALAVNSTLAGTNLYTAVTTWGGAADSVTSLSLSEAGIFNHASSAQGTLFQRIVYGTTILAASDILRVQMETNVGSS